MEVTTKINQTMVCDKQCTAKYHVQLDNSDIPKNVAFVSCDGGYDRIIQGSGFEAMPFCQQLLDENGISVLQILNNREMLKKCICNVAQLGDTSFCIGTKH